MVLGKYKSMAAWVKDGLHVASWNDFRTCSCRDGTTRRFCSCAGSHNFPSPLSRRYEGRHVHSAQATVISTALRVSRGAAAFNSRFSGEPLIASRCPSFLCCIMRVGEERTGVLCGEP